MLILFETSVGYALFKISNEKKLENVNDLAAIFQSSEKTQKL